MTTSTCLNCEKELTGKFCSGCGQKADTHRITFRNFLFHDLLHGAFHLERGILFTAKQALIRPGEAALEYISGKRKRYYNVFYLILLTIGVMLFTRHADELFASQAAELVPEKVYLNEASRKMDHIFAQKGRLILPLFVPFAAFNSFILFRKRKLNLSEHFIIAGMVLLGVLLIAIFGNIIFQINNFTQFDWMTLSLLVTALIIFYVGYGYVNAFGADYSKWGIASRTVLFFGLICLEAAILIFVLIGYVTNWDPGITVNIDPFG